MVSCYLSPEYFKTHDSADLLNSRKTPFSYANTEGKAFYEVLTANPEQHLIFNKAMKQQEPFLPTLGMFPFESLKDEVEKEQDRPFIVDVGSGRGHMLSIIREETSGGYGARMILQDLPAVLDSVSPEDIPEIEKKNPIISSLRSLSRVGIFLPNLHSFQC